MLLIRGLKYLKKYFPKLKSNVVTNYRGTKFTFLYLI